jgi:hypothetical protein
MREMIIRLELRDGELAFAFWWRIGDAVADLQMLETRYETDASPGPADPVRRFPKNPRLPHSGCAIECPTAGPNVTHALAVLMSRGGLRAEVCGG